ncbi:hypothetical protein [Streptomyces sp. NPDC004976]
MRYTASGLVRDTASGLMRHTAREQEEIQQDEPNTYCGVRNNSGLAAAVASREPARGTVSEGGMRGDV